MSLRNRFKIDFCFNTITTKYIYPNHFLLTKYFLNIVFAFYIPCFGKLNFTQTQLSTFNITCPCFIHLESDILFLNSGAFTSSKNSIPGCNIYEVKLVISNVWEMNTCDVKTMRVEWPHCHSSFVCNILEF